jgi:hypothetical protein
MASMTSNHALRQRRGLKRIERLVPQMTEKADKEGRHSGRSTRPETALRWPCG